MLLARFTCNFKCDKVRVIVAWGKNCSLFSRSKVVVTERNTEHAQTGYKIVINRARFVVNYKQPRPSGLGAYNSTTNLALG